MQILEIFRAQLTFLILPGKNTNQFNLLISLFLIKVLKIFIKQNSELLKLKLFFV